MQEKHVFTCLSSQCTDIPVSSISFYGAHSAEFISGVGRSSHSQNAQCIPHAVTGKMFLVSRGVSLPCSLVQQLLKYPTCNCMELPCVYVRISSPFKMFQHEAVPLSLFLPFQVGILPKVHQKLLPQFTQATLLDYSTVCSLVKAFNLPVAIHFISLSRRHFRYVVFQFT